MSTSRHVFGAELIFRQIENTNDKTPEGEVIDLLGLNRYCCRRHMLTHVDIEQNYMLKHLFNYSKDNDLIIINRQFKLLKIIYFFILKIYKVCRQNDITGLRIF